MARSHAVKGRWGSTTTKELGLSKSAEDKALIFRATNGKKIKSVEDLKSAIDAQKQKEGVSVKSKGGKGKKLSGDAEFLSLNVSSEKEVRGRFTSKGTNISKKGLPTSLTKLVSDVGKAQEIIDKSKTTENFASMRKGDISSAIARGVVVPPKILKKFKFSKRDLDKNKENRANLVEANKLMGSIKSLDRQSLAPNGGKGWKPNMTAAEADKYMADGGFFGKTSFWHGTRRQGLDSIQKSGADPNMNVTGYYGKGFYMGINKGIAQTYAVRKGAGTSNRGGQAAMGEFRLYSRNPLVVTSKQFDRLDNQSGSLDMATIARYKGYDSIYVSDLGYAIGIDKRQMVSVGNPLTLSSSKERSQSQMMSSRAYQQRLNQKFQTVGGGETLKNSASFDALRGRSLQNEEIESFYD